MKTCVLDIDELLREARGGDLEARGQLLATQHAGLRRWAERQLRGRLTVRVEAADLVQQTFLEAHRLFDNFAGEGETAFAAWLRSILSNKLARAVRDHVWLQKRSVQRARRARPRANGHVPRGATGR